MFNTIQRTNREIFCRDEAPRWAAGLGWLIGAGWCLFWHALLWSWIRTL